MSALDKFINSVSDEKLREKLDKSVGQVKAAISNEKQILQKVAKGEYPEASPARLFETILTVAGEEKYSIVAIDRASFTATFQTHKNEKFWDGTLSCFVSSFESGSRVSISGGAAQGATTSGKLSLSLFTQMTQVQSEGAQLGEEMGFKRAIAKRLPTIPEPPLSNENKATTERDIPTQIRELKALLDEGLLSQDEFEQAKSKLLNN
jgi:hypothetical protein